MSALQRAIDEVVRPAAAEVDAEAEFPEASIEALGEAGLLGLTVAEDMGGSGGSLADAVDVVRALAGVCGSTAMVVMMHYAATAVVESRGPQEVRRQLGAGRHLATLAFSEAGSRSHFWAPLGTATKSGDAVRLDARKSWITAAGRADYYVWSSRPVAAEGAMTLWLVPSATAGLATPGPFDGLGLRGNCSAPVDANGAEVPEQARLGDDGSGLDIALSEVLPWFLVLSAAFSVGVMEAVTDETGRHMTATRLEHLDQTLADQPVTRADHARMRIATDGAAALLHDTVAAVTTAQPHAPLRTLEVKAAAGEAAITVTDLAMKICGGAAFRRELGVERHFRDARAARVMAPTTDALLDFVGRAINGLPLL